MSAVSEVLRRPVEQIKPTEASPRFWTDVKVKQAWLGALAFVLGAAAAGAAVLTFTASLWFLAAAIPLLLASGTTVWLAARMIDYEDPDQLAKVREEAAKMPLLQVAEKHGWDRIFKFQILSPAQFDAAYRRHVEFKSLNNLISDYRFMNRKIDSSGARDAYRLPPPFVWREKLERETNGYNFSLIIGGYSLGDLIQFDLLSPETFTRSFTVFADGAPILEIIKCYNRARAQLQAAHGQLNPEIVQQFAMATPETWKDKFAAEWSDSEASEIASRFSTHLPSLLEYRIVGQEEYSLLARAKRELEIWDEQTRRARQEMDHRLRPYRTISEQAKEIARRTYDANGAHAQIRLLNEEMRDGEREIELLFNAQRREHPDKISEIRRERMERLDLLHGRIRRLEQPYLACLGNAEQLRVGACLLADAAFEATRASFEREMSREIAQITRERDLRLAVIDGEYREFQVREISLP